MKSRLKDKIKISVIVLVSVIAVVLMVSIISGRISTQEVVLVKSEGININLPLDQQLEFFKIEEFSKKEAKSFGTSVVTDFSQLANKKVNVPLTKGSPIPLSMLVEPNSGGAFATKLEEGKTIHHFPNGIVGLPPVEKGDKINVGLTYQDKNELGEQIYLTSVMLYDLEVANIVGVDLYVEVTLEESALLNNVRNIGEFFIQLPGKKEVPYCSELDELSIDIECLPEYFLPDTISQTEVIQSLKNGEAFNLTERQLKELIETVNESNKKQEESSDSKETDKNEEELDEENGNSDEVASNDDSSQIDMCVIVKGNTDSELYHLPDSPNYDQISSYEEFCSVEEAEAAGYSPAEN